MAHLDAAGAPAMKQAACLNCRRSKMKCYRNEGSIICTKCERNGLDCVVPEYHVGRTKGVKNKRSGLEKAVHQVEEALRKSRAREVSEMISSASDLSKLLNQTQSLLPETHIHAAASDLIPAVQIRSPYSSSGHFSRSDETPTARDSAHPPALSQDTDTNDLADAENPLQLLAQTLELRRDPQQVATDTVRPSGSARFHRHKEYRGVEDSDAFSRFFGRFTPSLDIGDDLDPIELGLITLPESETLFDFFFQNLAHTRWGVDPEIHTVTFVRSRSAFLFTSICAVSALFLSTAAAISRRLSIHSQKLAHNVITNRHRSVEIVLALMINIPWMPPGTHWADDETCAYLSEALTIAMDLSLHKVVRSSSQRFQINDRNDIPSADSIDPRKALQLDGFDDVESVSVWGRRLLRRRERTWLALFVLERGVCLARGRKYTLPMTPLVEICDKWHMSDIADAWDGSIISVAVLRRELAGLVAKVRKTCDDHEMSGRNGIETTQAMKGEIEGFFDRWYSTWPFQIGDRSEFRLPPYVEILASHTRLSLYSSVINHASAPVEVKYFFRAAGLASALNVMRAAVQGENQLKSMPNNTAIMISFAACFALEISAMAEGNRTGLAPSIRNLILETAAVLERIGSTTVHRNGASALYARQLRNVVQRSSSQNIDDTTGIVAQTNTFAQIPPQQALVDRFGGGNAANINLAASEPMMFSGMSNDEIVDTINNAGIGLEMSWADFQFGDGPNLDWLDWPA